MSSSHIWIFLLYVQSCQGGNVWEFFVVCWVLFCGYFLFCLCLCPVSTVVIDLCYLLGVVASACLSACLFLFLINWMSACNDLNVCDASHVTWSCWLLTLTLSSGLPQMGILFGILAGAEMKALWEEGHLFVEKHKGQGSSTQLNMLEKGWGQRQLGFCWIWVFFCCFVFNLLNFFYK